jgi:hypothetical protein
MARIAAPSYRSNASPDVHLNARFVRDLAVSPSRTRVAGDRAAIAGSSGDSMTLRSLRPLGVPSNRLLRRAVRGGVL